MDPFDPLGSQDSIDLQEMIDCDMQSELDEALQGSNYPCANSRALDLESPSTSNYELELLGENHLHWIQQQCLYNTDLEPTGLLVNPQTGLPIHVPVNNQLYAATPSPVHVSQVITESPSPLPSTPSPQPMPSSVPQNLQSDQTDTRVTSSTQITGKSEFPKPAYSYSCLIAMALKNSKTGNLPVSEIYSFMTENFPYFKTAPNGWKNSVRHNLSLNKCFEKVEKPTANASNKKGCLWAMNPAKVCKMEEEVQKWTRKDPQAIKRSMAHPENFDMLEKGYHDRVVASLQSLESPSQSSLPAECIQVQPVVPTSVSAVIEVKREIANGDVIELMESDLPLDTSLPDLNLQSGIWDELEDDTRSIHYGVSASSIQLNTANGNVTLPDTISNHPAITNSQGNYVYSRTTLNNNMNNRSQNANGQTRSKSSKTISAFM